MMRLEAFRSSAEFYDALFDEESRRGREEPFLRDMLDRAPGHRAVDIACGTGFHAKLLADLGAEVDAFDLSGAMVDHAKKARPHPRIRYAAGDMRRLSGGPWDLALCLGNSLCLLPDSAAVEETLGAVRAALAKDGLFLVQVLNYAKRAEEAPTHLITTKQVGDVEVTAIKSLVPKGTRTYLDLGFFARTGNEVRSIGETAVLMHLDEAMLRKSAEACGLQVQAVFGSLAESPYVPARSSDLVMVFCCP